MICGFIAQMMRPKRPFPAPSRTTAATLVFEVCTRHHMRRGAESTGGAMCDYVAPTSSVTSANPKVAATMVESYVPQEKIAINWDKSLIIIYIYISLKYLPFAGAHHIQYFYIARYCCPYNTRYLHVFAWTPNFESCLDFQYSSHDECGGSEKQVTGP